MEKKTFIRKHYDFNISLAEMQEKAKEEGGLCCYRIEEEKKLFEEFLPQVLDDGEEVEILEFEGEIWGLCPESVKVYPTAILRRYRYTFHK